MLSLAAPADRRAADEGGLARGVFCGLLGLMAWAPLPLASNRPWSWSFLSLVVGGLLVAWSAAAFARPELMRLSWRRCGAAGALFAAAVLWAFLQTLGMTPHSLHDPMWDLAGRTLGRTLQGAISADPAASTGGLMRLIAYGGVFWLAAQYGRRADHARRIVWCVVIVGIVYAAYGLADFSAGNRTILWYERWAYEGDLTSTFVSRSAFGAFAGVALLAALALVLRTVRRGGGRASDAGRMLADRLDALPGTFYLLIAGCLVLATALVLSHSRGAVAVAALGAAAMLLAMLLRHKGRRRQLAAAGLAMAVAGGLVLQLSGGVTLGRVLQLSEQGTGRDAIHALTRRGIEAAPLTGRGLDTFRHLYFRHRDSDIPWESPRYDKAHNTYLELLLELGTAGFALLMAAIAVVVGTICAGIVRRRRDVMYPVLGLGATVLLGAHALLDFSVQIPAIAVTYAALLGVAFAQSWPSDRPEALTAAAGADN